MSQKLCAVALAVTAAAFIRTPVVNGQAPVSTEQPRAAVRGNGETVRASSASFLRDADEGGQAEIALAQTAEAKAGSPEVKQLAETIRHDHEAADSEIGSLAARKNVSLPTSLSKSHQALADRLGRLSGHAFDKVYVDEMVKDHKADIATFRKHEKDPDPEIADWATKTLPVLQNHLKMAEDAQKAIGAK